MRLSEILEIAGSNRDVRRAGWGTAELAAAAGVDRSYVRRLLADGRIAGSMAGRDWVVVHAEAVRWLGSRGVTIEI